MEKYIKLQSSSNYMKFKYLFILVLLVFFIPFLSAQQESIGFVKQGSCITWKQVYSNATYTNFSDVKWPNGTTIIFSPEVTATKSGITFYKENCTYTSQVGEYNLCGHTDVDGVDTNWCYSYEVTYTGEEITSETATFNIIALVVLLFLFVITLLGINKLPGEDMQDQEGQIIQINQLKHLRAVLWVVAWLEIMAGIFIVSNILIAYLPINMLGKYLFTIWKIMMWITIIGLPVRAIWILVNFVQDKKTQRMIDRGLDVGGDRL